MLACCPLTPRPWLRAGWCLRDLGKARHHLPSQPRQPCQLGPYEWTSLGWVGTWREGVPLWGAVATAAHSSSAGSHCLGLSYAQSWARAMHLGCVCICA